MYVCTRTLTTTRARAVLCHDDDAYLCVVSAAERAELRIDVVKRCMREWCVHAQECHPFPASSKQFALLNSLETEYAIMYTHAFILLTYDGVTYSYVLNDPFLALSKLQNLFLSHKVEAENRFLSDLNMESKWSGNNTNFFVGASFRRVFLFFFVSC